MQTSAKREGNIGGTLSQGCAKISSENLRLTLANSTKPHYLLPMATNRTQRAPQASTCYPPCRELNLPEGYTTGGYVYGMSAEFGWVVRDSDGARCVARRPSNLCWSETGEPAGFEQVMTDADILRGLENAKWAI